MKLSQVPLLIVLPADLRAALPGFRCWDNRIDQADTEASGGAVTAAALDGLGTPAIMTYGKLGTGGPEVMHWPAPHLARRP